LPAQCAVGPDNVAELQALVASTPLLHSFYVFLSILSHSAVGPSGADLARFWDDSDGPERCYLAWRALSDIDKLLDVFFIFVRPHFPALREAVEDDQFARGWTLVNPALAHVPRLNWVSATELGKVSTVTELVGIWRDKTFDFWQNVHQRERSSLSRAPDCFLAPLPPLKQTRFQGGGGGTGGDETRKKGKLLSSDSSSQNQVTAGATDKVSKAKKPIIRWRDSVPSNARSPKDLYDAINVKGIIRPHFPSASLSKTSDQSLICFGFCIEGQQGGCKKRAGKTCKLAHLDGDSVDRRGPEAFGSLSAFLAQPAIAKKLEYTAVGRELAAEE
jgi:hypothetical protein